MTWSALKQQFIETLKEVYPPEEASAIFFIIVEDKYGWTKNHYLMYMHEIAAPDLEKSLTEDLKKLKSYIPVQHITGMAQFFGLTLKVNQHVLIPRPETEELVQLILDTYLNPPAGILDLCSGSGCIALALKQKYPAAKVEGYEWSREALQLSEENASLLKLDVAFKHQDVLNLNSQVEQWDCIVSNPPYISSEEAKQMEKQVLNHEPQMALFPEGDNPLIFYERIALFAKESLVYGGWVFAEINQYLAEKTRDLFMEQGFTPEVIKDINGNNRMIKAQKNHA